MCIIPYHQWSQVMFEVYADPEYLEQPGEIERKRR